MKMISIHIFSQNPFSKKTMAHMSKQNGKPAILQHRQQHDAGMLFSHPGDLEPPPRSKAHNDLKMELI